VTFPYDPNLYTFVTGTAEDGLLISAPAGVDYPEPFALAPNAEPTFLLNGGAADDPITVDFYSMPVSPRR
jgi:hypothetical protein